MLELDMLLRVECCVAAASVFALAWWKMEEKKVSTAIGQLAA